MRKLVACLGLCFLLVHVGNAYGQSKAFPPSYSELVPETKKKPTPTAVPPRRPIARTMPAERLIQQRAIRQAEQRRARIEARRWQGISLTRPTRLTTLNEFHARQMMDGPAWWAYIPRDFWSNTRR